MSHVATTHSTNGDRQHVMERFWTKSGPVEAELLTPYDIEGIGETQEASFGEPAAMALFGFAVGTLIIAWPISGFVPQATVLATIPPVLIFAGVAQFIGGLLALRRGNAFAGTAFCAYGANNTVVATFLLMQAIGLLPNTPGSPVQQMLALELYCFAYISLVLAVIALRLNAVFVAILLPLVPGFTLAGMANWYGPSLPAVWGNIGGYCLIASAAVAAYAATAMVLNSTWRQPVLPLFSPMPSLQTRDTARAASALRSVGAGAGAQADRTSPTARSTDPAAGPTRLQTDTRSTPPRTDPGATDDTFGPEEE